MNKEKLKEMLLQIANDNGFICEITNIKKVTK